MRACAIWCSLLGLLLFTMSAEAVKKPAVLFTGHLHPSYFAKPLYDAGIEMNTCDGGSLPTMLASGQYNVLVITGGLGDVKTATAVKTFLNDGGGVFLYPGAPWSEADYLATQHFLEGYGAHFTLSTIKESDPAKVVAAMFVKLKVAGSILSPFDAGVPGLLYLGEESQSGMTSPVSVVGDAQWKSVVKASPTAQAIGWTQIRVKSLFPYVNKAPETAPTLLAVREVGKGRLAAVGIGSEWMFAGPKNCPPIEDMLTRGRDGKPSNWIRLLANTYQWLAEPTLAVGKGGALTPEAVLGPPPASQQLEGWASEMLKPRDWTKAPSIDDQEQLPGIIGARSSYSGGKGSVAEWVKAAKTAGLKYIVFLEPLEFTNEENFNKLKADCAKNSDNTFFACPGLWGKDVYTKTSMYAYGEMIQFPLTSLLTKDGKYFDDSKGLDEKQTRTKYIFDYFFEQLGYKGQFGYFHHRDNVIPPWEYKMNNTFAVFTTENGKPVDDGFAAFSYLQATDFCYHPTAFSLLDDPAELARAVKEDWRVVNTAPGEFGDGTYTQDYGPGIPAMRRLLSEHIAWLRPFQYITQGPKIDCWRGRWEIVIPFGEWYRPDQWHYRVRLHATSDAGLQEITLMSAGKVAYRFLLHGAKSFDRTLDFENSQQRAMYPIITDVNGKRAIGSYVRNSNTLWNEFICGDRCNFLSYGMLRTADNQWHMVKPCGNGVTQNKGAWMAEISPAHTLTVDYPTLPIDGAPDGQKTPRFPMAAQIATPGYPSTENTNNRPLWVASGPDVLIGGGTLNYVIVDKSSWGNAWSWWSPIKPNEYVNGSGIQTAFAPLENALRVGWYEFRLQAQKDMPLTDKALPVTFTATNYTEFHDSDGHAWRADDPKIPSTGTFKRGAYILVNEVGGPGALVSMDDHLCYRLRGGFQIGLRPEGDIIAKGTAINGKIGYLGAPSDTDLEILRRYLATLSGPLPITGAPALGDGIAAHFDGKQTGVKFRFAPLNLHAYLSVVLEHMQPNWDVWVVDRTLKAPNWRQVVKVDDTAYAVLPCDAKKDYFLGHPILAENTAVYISLCNTLPGHWQVTLHNPTDQPIATTVRSNPDWPVFKLRKTTVTVPAGDSLTMQIEQR